MLWNFLVVLILTTGEIEQYESPPLPYAECVALQKQKQAEAEQRIDLRGLIVTVCEIVPVTAALTTRKET